ncbi:MAG: Mur ligase family protein [Candidatus Syntrophopropionicum ammoniitolerans]
MSHLAGLPQNIPVVLVNDTLQALQSLAAYNRIRISAFLVGVTGSTGKTTTKDILASVLATRLVTHKTSGNYNNEVGLPHTLLQMGHDCQAAVVEMAMRGVGEIDALCRIAKPDCAVITTINETHMELLGDLSSIAAAKGEILARIPPKGFALLPAESPFIKREAARCKGRVIFGAGGDADIRAENIRPTGRGQRL